MRQETAISQAIGYPQKVVLTADRFRRNLAMSNDRGSKAPIAGFVSLLHSDHSIGTTDFVDLNFLCSGNVHWLE